MNNGQCDVCPEGTNEDNKDYLIGAAIGLFMLVITCCLCCCVPTYVRFRPTYAAQAESEATAAAEEAELGFKKDDNKLKSGKATGKIVGGAITTQVQVMDSTGMSGDMNQAIQAIKEKVEEEGGFTADDMGDAVDGLQDGMEMATDPGAVMAGAPDLGGLGVGGGGGGGGRSMSMPDIDFTAAREKTMALMKSMKEMQSEKIKIVWGYLQVLNMFKVSVPHRACQLTF
jgi:hypothetical protein